MRNKARMSTLTTFIQHSFGCPSHSNQRRKRNKRIQTVKDIKLTIFRWYTLCAATAKSLQSWSTLCNPIDSSPSGVPIPGIPQARTLEWVAISFSNAWKWKWSRSVVSDSSNPMDCSLPGSSVHGIFQAKVLEWVAIAFSILYVENTKDNTRKLLGLISEFSKFAGCKINTHKSLAYLYTSNKWSERVANETVTSKILTNTNKILTLPYEAKDLYSKI